MNLHRVLRWSSVLVRAALLPAGFASAGVEPVLVASGLSAPLRVTAPAGDFQRLFVVEQGGRIRIVKDGLLLGRSFLDLSGRISSGSERGLLSLAFHPLYRRNGRFFVNYTDPQGNTVVSEFAVSSNPDFAAPGSERVLLRQTQPFSNHNGGHLAFSPIDGTLYLGLGDGGSGGDPQNLAQNDGTWLGKILRIDVDDRDPGKEYAVPSDNPFAGRTNPRPEIWAKGLRNPWRFSFDRTIGDLWIGDVGQGAWEEIDWQPASSTGGENYGWRRMEGFHCYDPASGCQTPSLTLPMLEYAHSATPPRCSVTGGVVSRGASVPEIAGRYLFADYCSGEIFSVRRLGGEVTDARNHRAERVPAGGRSIGSVTDLGEDARGDVYVTDSTGGEVFRLTTTTPSAMRLVPIVLDATGREDSRFSTELVVANRGASTATIRAVYTPAALLSGATAGTTYLRITLVSGARKFVLPETVRLEPGEWVQLDSVLARARFESGWAVVERLSGPGPFWAYAVFNDNGTSDGSYVAPVLPVRSVAMQVVPVVVETSAFESELVLANPGVSTVTARLLWVESLAAGSPRRFVAVEALGPGEQKILTGFVDGLRAKGLPVGARGGSYAGALFVTFEDASGRATQGYAGARTASPATGGGAYGLFTPAASVDDCAFREAWLFGLRQDDAVRTNLALVNADVDGGSVTLRYEVFEGAAGRKVGTSRDLVLEPGEWVQIDRALREYVLQEGYARVFRVSGNERFLAYAVINDGPAAGGTGTDDGSFILMEAAE